VPTLPWTIPATRAVPPDERSEIVVMASRLELRSLRDVPAFLTAAMRVRRQMLGSPGALGVSLIAKPLKRTFWTLSAWWNKTALHAAVGHHPHLQTVWRFRPRMAGSPSSPELFPPPCRHGPWVPSRLRGRGAFQGRNGASHRPGRRLQGWLVGGDQHGQGG
jgi:hypothetical protein